MVFLTFALTASPSSSYGVLGRNLSSGSSTPALVADDIAAANFVAAIPFLQGLSANAAFRCKPMLHPLSLLYKADKFAL
jgi:hypothetical protein